MSKFVYQLMFKRVDNFQKGIRKEKYFLKKHSFSANHIDIATNSGKKIVTNKIEYQEWLSESTATCICYD